MNVSIKFNEADVANVKTMLKEAPKIAPKVLSRAINDTLAGVKTDASTEVRAVITASKKAVDATFKTTKATVMQLSGKVSSTGAPLPLIGFSARQVKAGVSVQVKKARQRSVIKGAFIQTMKSGHKGVFWRQYHGAAKQPLKKISYGRLPKMYRLPMAQLFGPRIPDILGDDPVINAVLAKSDDRMHKALDKELNYELSKL